MVRLSTAPAQPLIHMPTTGSAVKSGTVNSYSIDHSRIHFTENKGQVHDQFFKPRPDVLFSGSNGQFTFHLRKNGVSYQLTRVNSWRSLMPAGNHPGSSPKRSRQIPDSTTVYRLDIGWLGANPRPSVIGQGMQSDYDNYFLSHCPQGITGVKKYRQIRYQQLYEGIDMVWYEKNGELEYDFQVSAGADYRQIKMAVEGADSMYLSRDGDLVLVTPLGTLTEQAPLVIQKGKSLPARWILKNRSVQFEIDNVDPGHPMVIDPVVRMWGTYYGGPTNFFVQNITLDKTGNVYMAGGASSLTGTQIATTGSHQSSFGGSYSDGMLVKFNPAGVRQWATYYGGSGGDLGFSCAADATGSIYMCGATLSASGIATPGSHQTTYQGGNWEGDAFLVKFNSGGIRQWATYYGGSLNERGITCSTDSLNNIYLGGWSNSSGGIATPGSHQSFLLGSEYDGFLVKFNSEGVRQWGTYFGGFGRDLAFSSAVDPAGNIYLAGETFSFDNENISTNGSHQPFLNGGQYHGDAFLVKFNTNGVRQWSTYYGGLRDEMFYGPCSLAIDDSSNVFLAAFTLSSSEIASPGAHQENHAGGIFAGGSDAFLVKFNAAGVRQWATYYGDIDEEISFSCTTDGRGNVFLCGETRVIDTANTVFGTPGSYQPYFAGGSTDGFLCKFSPAGVRIWGSYYGGDSDDFLGICLSNKFGSVFLAGLTFSPSGISTPNGHQPGFIGGISDYNTFLVKLTENVFEDSLTLCAKYLPYLWHGQTLTAAGNYTAQLTTLLGIDSVFYLSLTVNDSSQSSTSVNLCENQLPYTWNGLSCNAAGSYSVVLTNYLGCDSIATLNLSVGQTGSDEITIYPNPTSDYLNIHVRDNSCFFSNSDEIKIYNAIGQFVHYEKQSASVAPYSIRINISHLSSGMYFVRMGNTTQKVMILR